MASHLSTGVVNLAMVREEARRELLRLLDKCAGPKALVWDYALTDRFGLIAEFPLLKEHEVERMFPLAGGKLAKSTVQHIIFITRPKLDQMDFIAQNIQREEDGTGFGKEFHVFFVPWKSYLCLQKLEELGVSSMLKNIEEYRLDLIPLEYDLLSMEHYSSLFDCTINEDYSSLYLVARALNSLQKQFGIIPNIHCKGRYAQMVCEIMKRIRLESKSSEDEGEVPPQIDRLLILDRSVDLLSPLVTQLTYEGLIDEVYEIKNATAKFPPEKFSKEGQNDGGTTEPKKIILSSKDELFAILRDRNFNAVGPTLKVTAKQITEQFEERHAAKTVGEIKKFVSHLPQMQQAKANLASHTSIAELIKEHTDTEGFLDTIAVEQEFLNGIGTDKVNPYIEDCLFKKKPLHKVLRLICLQNLTNNGLKPKVLDYYKREILHTYGFENVITLRNLEKSGLMQLPCKLWNYNTIRKSLRLVVEDINEKDPRDIAYVHSGYAPLSARLTQIHSHPGWRSIEEVLRLLPGPPAQPIKQSAPRRKRMGTNTSNGSIVTLVFFVGGVTYAEISALRFLSSLESGGPKDEYIVATTSIINGNSMIKGFLETCNDKS
uniref:vacuolar protein sorting-associated protein 33A-like n=1 Tax=Styela clava TaxID=7725 RepID=UPI00193A6961|nr:vacuolar protein sorting-associated protein 33A-like [Styela clava]